MKKKELIKKSKVFIGIPCRYSSASIVNTIDSIRLHGSSYNAKLMVIADHKPVDSWVVSKLKKQRVLLKRNKKEGSQLKKQQELIKNATNEDIFIFTQDDVLFTDTTIEKIVEAFRKYPQVTMVATKVDSYPASTFLEKILEVGVRVVQRTAPIWRKGDNYLLANGRCLAFNLKFLKKFNLPTKIINGDGYLYFENKFRGGSFKYVPSAVVYNKNPQYFNEYVNQVKRFGYSCMELSNLYKRDLSDEYKISSFLLFKGLLPEFQLNPIVAILYIFTNLIAKKRLVKLEQVQNTQWDVAKSTKRT